MSVLLFFLKKRDLQSLFMLRVYFVAKNTDFCLIHESRCGYCFLLFQNMEFLSDFLVFFCQKMNVTV